MHLNLDFIQKELASLATAILTSKQETEMITLPLEIPRQLINIAVYIGQQSGKSRDEVLSEMCLNNLNSSISELVGKNPPNEMSSLNNKMNELTDVMSSFTSIVDKLNSLQMNLGENK
jgi:hypothetical protein